MSIEQDREKSSKKKVIAVVIIAIVILVVIIYANRAKDQYSFKDDTLFYSKNREKPEYSMTLLSKNAAFTLYKINFSSRNFLTYPTNIYGLLLMPNTDKPVPGIVLLPGGGGTKEVELKLASLMANQGYAVLTIDQRGVGETGGDYLDLTTDYKVFASGKEPIQHLSVYDALRTFDVLKQIKGVDSNNIAIAGESMGGRYAAIAAGIDDRIKGAILISVAGYHVAKDTTVPYNPFLISIDPDHYISMIQPRPVMMLQGSNDTVVPPADAEQTFALAGNPKSFFLADGCNHGYCEKMHDALIKDLNTVLDK